MWVCRVIVAAFLLYVATSIVILLRELYRIGRISDAARMPETRDMLDVPDPPCCDQ